MPITSSAKKALRQNKTRNAKNVANREALKRIIKEYKRALVATPKEAVKLLPGLYARIDKSVKNKVIKKNRAARLKSRLTKKLPK